MPQHELADNYAHAHKSAGNTLDDGLVRELYDSNHSSIDIASILGWSKYTVLASLWRTGGVRSYAIDESIRLKLDDPAWLTNELSTKSIRTVRNDLGCSNVIAHYMKKHKINSPISRETHPERVIRGILESIDVKYIQYDYSSIPPYELDFYCPEHNIAIETNGAYWHSDLFKDKEYHHKKYKLCKDAGIQLLQLWDSDINNKQDIVTDMVLHKFGASNKDRVYGRNCTISDIDTTTTRTFMNLYHINGYAPTCVNIGLIENSTGECVAVLSHKNNTIVRYATSKVVVGGFSKLIKPLPRPLITFADNMHTLTGDVYTNSGFVEDSRVSVDYKYLYKHNLYHKSLFERKRFRRDSELLYNSSFTLEELLGYNNINRVYDAGKIKYILG